MKILEKNFSIDKWWKFIKKYNISWNWYEISKNSNLTIKIINKFSYKL